LLVYRSHGRANLATRFKRSGTLAFYWQHDVLVCQNYRARSRTTINSRGIELLEFFNKWRTVRECANHFAQYSPQSVHRAVDELARRELLVKQSTRQAVLDAACQRAWEPWTPEAALMHFGTKDVKYVSSADEIDTVIEGLLQASPQPAFTKIHRGAPRLVLPKPDRVPSSFADVATKRRTHRTFSAQSLNLEQLSALLYFTWGVTGFLNDPVLGCLPLKTSPSGGARHPEEVYVAALRVKGLRRGLYHYVTDRHSLELISTRATRQRVIDYCAGQQWVGGAAALFLMTAVFARTMWKYPVARTYRLVLAEAGHLCQTFCLVATSLGLGPFCTMALKDSLIETDLCLNGIDEAVLYVAGVGVPAPSKTPSQ
jgi:SagB-type dehydrogenase family enzyme